MMNKQVAAIVLTVALAGGVGAGVVAHAITSDPPATKGTSTPTEASSQAGDRGDGGIAAPDDLVIEPGGVGPVRAGMSRAEALKTGYFVADVEAPAEGCPDVRLAWKDEYVHTYDVYTLGNGEITSIGIRGDGAVTADGVGVGSTYDEVSRQYPDETLVEAGYAQSGIRVFDQQNGGWMGFLFDEPVGEITGGSKVTFVEVTKGAEPGLMRDGC